MKGLGSRLIIGRECSLTPLLAQLPQLFARRFVAFESLLKSGVYLFLLIGGQIELLKQTRAKITAQSGAATKTAPFSVPLLSRSRSGILSRWLLGRDGAKRGQ